MIDHFGHTIKVGYSEHELIWLRAAMTLPRGERISAFRDIAEMTGRPLYAIQCAAYRIHSQDVAAQIRARSLVVAARVPHTLGPIPGGSDFRWPSMAAKMGGKALAPYRKPSQP